MDNNLAGITLNRQQFLRLAQSFEAYGLLERAIGPEKAARVVQIRYEIRVLQSNPEGRYIMVPEGTAQAEAADLEHILITECAQIAAKDAHVTELLAAASEGALRPRLGAAAENAGQFSRERDIAAAAGWVCHTMHGGGIETVRALLSEHACPAPGTEVLGPCPALLDGIHARIFPHAPSYRSSNPAVSYPSSTGGRHLLEAIFKRTAGAVWPLPGNVWWLDVALFFMGAIGTVQAYSDGNKRAARMAYAIILLRGRRAFVAPSDELEADLFQMLGPAGS